MLESELGCKERSQRAVNFSFKSQIREVEKGTTLYFTANINNQGIF